MSETKFTPGPWEWDEEEYALYAHPAEDEWTHIFSHAGIKTPDTALIAAAPELYEALEGLLEDHERICEAHNKYPGPTRCGDAARARAALAKARGES